MDKLDHTERVHEWGLQGAVPPLITNRRTQRGGQCALELLARSQLWSRHAQGPIAGRRLLNC